MAKAETKKKPRSRAESDAPERSIDELAPSPANPRSITDAALAGLGASLAAYGDLSGIVFNRRSGNLVAGHQRMRALREAGAASWTWSGERGEVVHPRTGERFPVRVVDWDEQTETAANLVANNAAIQGDFTAAALEQLTALSESMPAEAFEALRLDAMMVELGDLAARSAEPPADFPAVGEDVATEHKCPKCGYEWSGKTS